MVVGRRMKISALEEHPNIPEINGILARLPSIDDAQLVRLAAAWRNTPHIASARSRALAPDAPLILEVLQAFEHVTALFLEEIEGSAPYVRVTPQTALTALKAVRDALAAAFAQPLLTWREYEALIAPWRQVYPVDPSTQPDLGPQGERVRTLINGMARLATRCHDEEIAALFVALARRVSPAQELRQRARDEAWEAAVLTSRRRLWTMVRRQGAVAFARWCSACRRRGERDLADAARLVRDMCLDAACALLVADAVDETLVEILTLPARPLLDAAPS
ncbi:MAG: hypothetical protein GEV03_13510 [Streptosporangiales bacterium]|nr:hypothetical protein [Streptosporangiales bacterium]